MEPSSIPGRIANSHGISSTIPDVIYDLKSLNIGERPQYSLQSDSRRNAVLVEDVCKSYGDNESSSARILDNFCMKVPSGAIYSLLGSSGCGKTTILSCIVGLQNWDSGSITVLGQKQGIANSQYLRIGESIGYMPQDMALYDHLSILEMFRYYGKLYGMTNDGIEDRWRSLSKLLKIETKRHIQIHDLSGGQKRRISLALALVHKPALIVLDEPTVGLDPLLRQSIWSHLYELVTTNKTTVIITTHYIEETRFSNRIGIMRNGRLLREDSPLALLSTYNSTLLQDAILSIYKYDHNLSRSATTTENQVNSLSSIVFQVRGKLTQKSLFGAPGEKFDSDSNVAMCGFRETNPEDLPLQETYNNGSQNLLAFDTNEQSCLARSISRTFSFSTVIWIYLMRQPIFAFIFLFLPAVQLFMTFYVVGKDPTNLQLGIINYETVQHGDSYTCLNASLRAKGRCDLELLSCNMERDLFQNEILDVINLNSEVEANDLIQQGSLFGYVTFPRNYSENLVNRFITGKFASDNDTLEGSKFTITLDKSNYMAYHIILKEVLQSFDHLAIDLEETCGFERSYSEVPLFFREPVFGKLNGTHQESIMPAIVVQILFEVLYGIAPMILIKDLKQGTFSRANLAGLRFSEFLLGIFVTMAPILILQSVSCYMILEFAFPFQVKGSLFVFIFICLLAGLCGQSFGIFMGVLVKSEFAVIVSAIMIVPILMTCSGTLWPVESHPYSLTIIYYIFPSALIVSSLRSVVSRGVGITHRLVWPGLVNAISWSVAFWILSILVFRRTLK